MGDFYTIKFSSFGEIKKPPSRGRFYLEICQFNEIFVPKKKEKQKERRMIDDNGIIGIIILICPLMAKPCGKKIAKV